MNHSLKTKSKTAKRKVTQRQKLQKNITAKSTSFKSRSLVMSESRVNPDNEKKLLASNFGFNLGISVNNEFDKLAEVITHRPGPEVERLIPNQFKNNHFSSNMHLERAQREHDLFTSILKKNGVQVSYVEKLLAEALEFAGPFVKDNFIKQFVTEAKIFSTSIYETCVNYFRSFNTTLAMINAMIAGVKHNEVPPIIVKRFNDVIVSDSPFLIYPLPKLLFPRDFFLALNHGLAIFKLFKSKFTRETIFYEYIIKYHPRFNNLRVYFNRDFNGCKISGNDLIQLSSDTLLIGVTKNTDVNGVETLTRNVFNDLQNKIKRVIAVFLNDLPISNLLEGFSVIDVDKFIVNETILETKNIYELLPSKEKDVDGLLKINFKQLNLSFSQIIEAIINKKPKFVICGGGDYIRGERERMDHGLSALAIAPGEIIVYDRNRHTNKLLSEIGVIIHTISSAELSRGSGGPLNMITTLWRN